MFSVNTPFGDKKVTKFLRFSAHFSELPKKVANFWNICQVFSVNTPFGDKKVTEFSGFPPTSVSYLKRQLISGIFAKCSV